MVAVVGSTGSANRDGEHSHVTGELKRTVTRVNRETARAIFFPAGGCAVVACSSLGGLMGDVMYTRVSRQQTAVCAQNLSTPVCYGYSRRWDDAVNIVYWRYDVDLAVSSIYTGRA